MCLEATIPIIPLAIIAFSVLAIGGANDLLLKKAP